MILMCKRTLTALINGSGESQRHGACVQTYTVCEGSVAFQHTQEYPDIQDFASFSVQCNSINCNYRPVPGLKLISQCEQSLSAQIPTLA